jgi:soluble lytic murein transglycosylase-like protein
MVVSASCAVLLIQLGTGSLAQSVRVGGVPGVQSGASIGTRESELMELVAVRRLFNALARQRQSNDEGKRAASWAELSLLVEAVAGERAGDSIALDELAAVMTNARGLRVPATPGVSARDTAAYGLLALGYSARETADVVSGRISRRALDTARNMLMVGHGADAAANYLDSQYRKPRPSAPFLPPVEGRTALMNAVDVAIERYARLHQVDSSLVRAVIAVESAFNPAARSRAGAIGLMQLMPATARELGVDPTMPEQNIEGGVRYLSGLLKMFGGVELALVAYNGGPGFARRYARGHTALYGETRDYVKRVLSRVRAMRS